MEINDIEVDGAMEIAPTVGSQALAPTPSHSQNESASHDANETPGCDTLDDENMMAAGGSKRKFRSAAWDHFERQLIGGKWKAICNDCKKALGGETKNGTRHLLDHIKTCLHKKQKTIKQSLLQPTKSSDETMMLGTYHFNQDHARKELANMITLHEYPLSMVDHVGFKRYSHALQPLFKVVSRNTKKLELDCKTRWNSTYLMLNTALEYKDVFARLKHRETLYKRVPTEEDWLKVREICSKLEIFYDATALFSGTKYPTINIFFSTFCDIKLAINDWVLSDDIVVKTMAINMRLKFEKYWVVMNSLLAIGSILDPRYKMKTIQFYYPLVYGDMSSLEIEKLKKSLYDLIEEYKKKSKQFREGKNSQSSSSRPPLPKRGSYADKFEMFMDSNVTTELEKSELDYYLEESLLPRNTGNFDILCWWKTNGIKYPILHDVAKDLLAIPVTTVASESTFSTGGRVLSVHRNKLHPKTVEALMCARDWLWSEMQDSTTSKDESFDDDSDIEEMESCTKTNVEDT